ncbi:hypothetical protein DRE_03313 [Drechslerella stenobrocha 248]|uniref:LysM domain-containing protein n=1 Tax=Drechslerella stenobrocha 248 TaxID=1043628 RepID=W7HUL5_9PEZI|nr:hypothetical protein DRE_03313 [Drechslerella stenobrocha 248]
MASEEIASCRHGPSRARLRSPHQRTSRYLNRNPVAQEWGPSGAQINAEEPQKQNLRAALLVDNEATQRHSWKRRSSVSADPETISGGSGLDDVLVYVHNVQHTDTLARVLLVYDIEPGALRRANRLWPNDSIQMRSQLYLPVNDCAVKGILLPGKDYHTAFTTTGEASGADGGSQAQSDAGNSIPSSQGVTVLRASKGHHSFIYIEHIGPVEIVRLAKPKLSHFPPTTNERYTPRAPVGDCGGSQETEFSHMIREIAKESYEGLEIVGTAIESFVKKVAANTRINWVNKTTSDLIELTSHIGGRSHSTDHKKSNMQQSAEIVPKFREIVGGQKDQIYSTAS